LQAFATGDDGLLSDGFRRLLSGVRTAVGTVVAALPLEATVGAGTALGRPTGVAVATAAVDGIPVYAWSGTPSSAVLAACDGAFGIRPDLVAAGINHGPNVGLHVVHSGTFGAALAALSAGLPAVAVSLDDVYSTGGREDGPMHWDSAAAVVAPLVRWLAAQGRPVLLNVNVPNIPRGEIRGVRRTALARAPRRHLAARQIGAGGTLVGPAGGHYRPDQCAADSDVVALAKACVSVTAISGLLEDRAAGDAAAAGLDGARGR